MAVEVVHWTDARGRSLLGIVRTFNDDTKHFIDLVDVSPLDH